MPVLRPRLTAVALGIGLLTAFVPACGGGKATPMDGGTAQADAGDSGTGADADASGGALEACLDRPSELPRAPMTRLPCELVPPGLRL